VGRTAQHPPVRMVEVRPLLREERGTDQVLQTGP
jgi:hypothetical protein